MMEFHPTGAKGSNIGRKAGSYSRAGSVITIDQSVLEYREELISITIANDKPLSTATPAIARTGALLLLYPEAAKVSREKFRAYGVKH